MKGHLVPTVRRVWVLVFFIVVFLLNLSCAVEAQTQNVKMSGSMESYWFYRSHYDLSDDHGGSLQGGVAGPFKTDRTNGDDWFMSVAQINVAANLTDNVSTAVNLMNQRDWNASVYDSDSASDVSNQTRAFDVIVDKAYVQLKEIFYAPLTVMIGRQDLSFGRGFLIGYNLADPTGSIAAKEFTSFESFDAVRATLDFNPWTIDLVCSKIDEGNINNEDDSDLYIAYITYKYSEYNGVLDVYYISQWDRSRVNVQSGRRASDVECAGGRLQFDPIQSLTMGAEAATQFGHYEFTDIRKKSRQAWGADIFTTYRWDLPWKPDLTAEAVYFSGESDLSDRNSRYGAWNSFFRGSTYGTIHEYLEVYYTTAQQGDQPADQNVQSFFLTLNLTPSQDLQLSADAYWFWAAEDIHLVTNDPTSPKLDHFIGQEIDSKITYAYTEDVCFGLQMAWFFPGDLYQSPNNKTAMQIVTNISVSF